MNKEQNIDDILKLLKDSVSSSGETEPQNNSNFTNENLSTEDLQQQLKSQYASDITSKSSDYSQNEYVIDSDFLNDTVAEESQTEKYPQEEVKENAIDGQAHEIVIEQMSLFGEPERTVVQLKSDVVDKDDSKSENVLVLKKVEFTDSSELENLESVTIEQIDMFADTQAYDKEYEEKNTEEITSVSEENKEDEIFDIIEDKSNDDKADNSFVSFEKFPKNDEFVVGEISEDIEESTVEKIVVEEASEENISEEFEFFDSDEENIEMPNDVDDEVVEALAEEQYKVESVAEPTEPHETFLASMRKIGIDFTTDDIYNSTVKNNHEEKMSESFLEDADDGEIIEEQDLSVEELDDSTINIMMQFCDKNELDQTIGDRRVDEFFKEQDKTVSESKKDHVAEGREYMNSEQNDRISENYCRRCQNKLLSFIGCAAIAVIALVLDLLPLIDVRLSGIFDYNNYPAVYALIGLQMLVIAAAIRYKEYWENLKLAFSPSPTYGSLVSVVLTLTAIYDLLVTIIIVALNDRIPCMYNGMATFLLALSALCDYLDLLSETKSFAVYSSESKKYTLFKESHKDSIGKKMYGGGLEADKNIYSIRDVDFPSGFFCSIGKKTKTDRLVILSIIPMLMLGAIGAIASIFLKINAYASFACFIVCAYALMPISLMLCKSLIKFISVNKLAKRGIAISGDYSARKYSDVDVMVFGDLHMFKKCKTEDIGIVIYDTKVGYLTLGCLDALYSKIGGPMSGMQMNLPDVFKFTNVSLKRMTRNGIEAVIDGKHTIIVGEPTFMQRYGLSFPPNEVDNGRSTLCVSLNGKITAKISVKYEVEPIFEMLVERLYSEGITCAIQTFDPLINSGIIAKSRTIGESPISVIHGDAKDFATDNKSRYNTDYDGLISCSSRLKLCEAEVWIKRLERIRKRACFIGAVLMSIGVISFILMTSFGVMPYINQWYILLYLALSSALMCIPALMLLPCKDYFTLDAMYSELEKTDLQKQAEARRERSKKIRKITKQDK